MSGPGDVERTRNLYVVTEEEANELDQRWPHHTLTADCQSAEARYKADVDQITTKGKRRNHPFRFFPTTTDDGSCEPLRHLGRQVVRDPEQDEEVSEGDDSDAEELRDEPTDDTYRPPAPKRRKSPPRQPARPRSPRKPRKYGELYTERNWIYEDQASAHAPTTEEQYAALSKYAKEGDGARRSSRRK